MGLLDGKVALITGGSRGQGRAHAVTCAREGAHVVIVDVTKPTTEVDYALATDEDHHETVRQVEALGRRCVSVDADVRDQASLDGAVTLAVQEFGRIDILIANAGIWTKAPFWEMSEQQWHQLVDVNLTGIWKSAKAVAPHMIERRSGSIVVISSNNAIEPLIDSAHYNASKSGALGLMKSIALELAPYGVRCNAICPGFIKTPMTSHQRAWDMFAGRPGGTEADMAPAGRSYTALRNTEALDPSEIASTALYLNSHLANKVTGVVIPVDGGHLLLPATNSRPVVE
ncbi:mycofactocin-coupled SDR family oxidoreductase [Nocardioides sp. WS12]|uniref:mycofactocin-coupled SDR family oxidoreductase n=1 Tax=Nocardioides sp. WS12 TaxID=2486272 RepID=UPI0015FE7C8F|nr:mycofactocin-coupled SDR family oxidoreductase [Nocardioides sp. WS12]